LVDVSASSSSGSGSSSSSCSSRSGSVGRSRCGGLEGQSESAEGPCIALLSEQPHHCTGGGRTKLHKQMKQMKQMKRNKHTQTHA
jgi:hypothetical protein